MWIVEGDAAFDMEGLRYRFHGHSFYGRLNNGDEYHTYGVAYSYGGKDSRSTYESKMDETDSYAAQPLNNWSDYSSSHPKPNEPVGPTASSLV